MARILAWCDSPTAPTGFGRSAKHILHAFHGAGHDITQLAINYDEGRGDIPWRIVRPDRATDPYGLKALGPLVAENAFDVVWVTFDPQVPFSYALPGEQHNALDALRSLKVTRPGCRIMGWFPVDGGPLSDYELTVLGGGVVDHVATMSPHVHDLIEWSIVLRGQKAKREEIEQRVHIIPHGIDLDTYYPDTAERDAIRKQCFGVGPDDFLVVQVERNQQRKQPWLAFEVMEVLFRRSPKLRGRVKLYQHMHPDEESQGCMLGFNLPDLAWRYGLRPGVDVVWPAGHLPEDAMRTHVYGAGDAFLSVSTGEGFQYPAWEAVACGLPVILPNDSARAAWFRGVVGAHLYATAERSLVIRGGYNRRMNLANPAAAATVVRKMVERQQKYQRPDPQAMHEWVARTSPVGKVQQAYLAALDEQLDELRGEREAQGVYIQLGHECDADADMVVRIDHPLPGLGDMVQAAPAFHALQRQGKRVVLQVPRERLEIAQVLRMAGAYDLDGALKTTHLLNNLWSRSQAPGYLPEWHSPTRPRREVIAEFLGLPRHAANDMPPLKVELPEQVTKGAEATLRSTFGVEPASCVALASEAGVVERTLPAATLQQVIDRLLREDLVPVIVGTKPLNIRRVGVLDLSGQTSQLATLLGLLATVGATIATDSAAFHFSAMLGTPTVGVFPVVPAEARAKGYDAKIVAVEPPPNARECEGIKWPPTFEQQTQLGGAWARRIPASAIVDALHEVIGDE